MNGHQRIDSTLSTASTTNSHLGYSSSSTVSGDCVLSILVAEGWSFPALGSCLPWLLADAFFNRSTCAGTDNEVNQKLLIRQFSKIRYGCEIAHDGQFAIERLQAAAAEGRRFDCVLMGT